MTAPTLLSDRVDPVAFMKAASSATRVGDIEALLGQLSITPEEEYSYNPEAPDQGWREGSLHWMPVGRERGNAGRIKQANTPVNPIAERTVNGGEALIELYRQRELLNNPTSPDPSSPRDAVMRYFGLPSLDGLPKLDNSETSKRIRERARELSKKVRVSLGYDKADKSFTVLVEDDGIGQSPTRIHRTLLSLGSTTKADKFYLIGVFGQGGSSAYAVSKYSWVVSRRAPDLLNGDQDGAGWTIIKHVFPKGRRDVYFAYLAAHPDGRVPSIDVKAADTVPIAHGTRFAHIGYDFGRGGSAITRQLYAAMNHVLYNPVLPYELTVSGTVAPMYGNGYRLSLLSTRTPKPSLDKLFPPQTVGI